MDERAFDAVEEQRRQAGRLADEMLQDFLAGDPTEEELQAVLAVLERIAQSHRDAAAGRSRN